MKTLSKAELLGSIVSGVDISCVWSKQLQQLLKERDELFEEVTKLRIENMRIADENETLRKVTEEFTFVRLYA